MAKKITALLLLALCLFGAASAHWADSTLEKWANYGAVNWDENWSLRPDDYILREEAAQALSCVIEDEISKDIEEAKGFSDITTDSVYYKYIEKAIKYGVMNGISEDEFGVGSCLTREQTAVILFRVFKDTLPRGGKTDFSDFWDSAEWAVDAVAVLAGNDIISGYLDGSFRPRGVITRAEFIALLDKLTPNMAKIKVNTADNSSLPAFDKIDPPPPPPVEVPLSESLKGKKLIAITYDDGPHKTLTPRLLDILKNENVKVTFFVVGTGVTANPSIVKRAADEGHQIANHTYNHKDLSKQPSATIKSEVSRAADAIEKAMGARPTLMRPPYGAVNATVKSSVGTPLILWSVDPQDWRYRNSDTVYNHVTSKARDGDIVLMHDIHQTTVAAAERIIKKLKADGFTFVTVSELIEARGGASAGKTYGSFR